MPQPDSQVEILIDGEPLSSTNPLPSSGGGGEVDQGAAGSSAWLVKLDQTGTNNAVDVADGSDVALGTTTDAAVDTDTTGTVSGKLRGIVKLLVSVISGGRLKTTDPTYTAPAVGELAGSATSVQMPSVACSLAMFKAAHDNAGKVYIGVATGVTKADGTTDTTTGWVLAAGEETGWLPIDNTNRLWRICDNAGDDLVYMIMA